MLDSDLADLYETETKTLNRVVLRNSDHFPPDFMFKLTPEEYEHLKTKGALIIAGKGKHSKYLPRAFTEEGVAMLSTVLRNKRAVEINIAIMRAFVHLRRRESLPNPDSDLIAKYDLPSITRHDRKEDQSLPLG